MPPDRTAPPSTSTHLARHLRRLHHPLSTCCLASRWKEDVAFLRSFYVADDIWRFAWSGVGCLLALSWLPKHTHRFAKTRNTNAGHHHQQVLAGQ